MGKLLKQYANGKFNVWSTITDQYDYDQPLSRKDLIGSLDLQNQLDAKLKTIEEFMVFPGGWVDKDKGGYINPQSKCLFLDWHIKVLREKRYYEIVEEKYEEVMKALED